MNHQLTADVAPKNRSSVNERFVLKLNLKHNMNHEKKISPRTNHIIQEAQGGLNVKALCRKYAIAAATYYRWENRFEGLTLWSLNKP